MLRIAGTLCVKYSLMDVFTVRNPACSLISARIKYILNCLIGQFIWQRPFQAVLLSQLANSTDRISGTLNAGSNLPLTVTEAVQSQYFPIIHHVFRPPIMTSHIRVPLHYRENIYIGLRWPAASEDWPYLTGTVDIFCRISGLIRSEYTRIPRLVRKTCTVPVAYSIITNRKA